MNDLRFAFRQLLKHPGITAVTVLTLTLGIGANTAIFSLLDGVVLKLLPVRKPEELVLFNWLSGPKRMARNVFGDVGRDPATELTTSTSFSYRAFERLRDHPQGLADVFAFTPRRLSVRADGEAEIVSGQLVSGGYYAGLGVQPIQGRTISGADDKAASSPVAVITAVRRRSIRWRRCAMSRELRIENCELKTGSLTESTGGSADQNRFSTAQFKILNSQFSILNPLVP